MRSIWATCYIGNLRGKKTKPKTKLYKLNNRKEVYFTADAHSHHAYCRRTSVLKHVTFSRLSVYSVYVVPPEDLSVVKHESSAHPAAGPSGLTSRAHAGSTGAAHKHTVQCCFIIIFCTHTFKKMFILGIPLCNAVLYRRHAPCVFLVRWWWCCCCCFLLRAS